MSERYTHRNGETDPPTEIGWYWFRGSYEGSAIVRRDLVKVTLDEDRGVMLWPVFIPGWLSPSDLIGEWWGPVAPPWEQDE